MATDATYAPFGVRIASLSSAAEWTETKTKLRMSRASGIDETEPQPLAFAQSLECAKRIVPSPLAQGVSDGLQGAISKHAPKDRPTAPPSPGA